MPTRVTPELIAIAPDQDVHLVLTDVDGEGAGTLEPWALATSFEVTGGLLVVLATADVLAVYAPGEWQFVGQVRLAVGHSLAQRDGRVVICK